MKTTIRKFGKITSIIMFGAMIAGCQPDEKIDPRAGGGGLQGSWASADGIFTANFNNGSFIATANDTGSVISEGSYIAVAFNQVNLKWNGKVTGSQNSATCARPDVTSLNCTDAAGRSFTLIKTSS